jgi:hypothetical protein
MSEAPTTAAEPTPPPVDGTGTLVPPEAGSPLGGAPAGGDTVSGTDTVSGNDTLAGTEGNDTLSGNDSLTDVALASTDLVIPEGMTVDDAQMSEFLEFANANKLPKEAAQSALDLYTKNLQAVAEQFAQSQQTTWKETLDTWKADLAKDPDFSGDNMAKSQITIGRALDEYGSPEAREAFELTGAGWNPAIIRFVHNMAKALGEGTLVPGGKPPAQRARTPGEAFYPNET